MAGFGSLTKVSRSGVRISAAFLSAIFMVVSVGLSEAQAKRMGGGGSIGKSVSPMQRQATPPSNSPQRQTPPTQQAAPTQQPAGASAAAPAAASQAASGASRWMAPLAGLAAGLGLAALASHLGLGEELMGMLMIVLLVAVGFFILRMVLARGRGAASSGAYAPAMARSGLGASGLGSGGAGPSGGWNESAAPHGSATGSATPDFAPADQPISSGAVDNGGMAQAEIDQFLQVARAQFMSLQKLWDAGDLRAIEGFCTPVMAQELASQLAARGHAVNYTSVVQLEVEWMGLQDGVNEDGHPVEEAYVGFKGLVRETADGTADAFHEVWVLQKRKDGRDGWLLAGISQHA